MTGAELIAQERTRQVCHKAWTEFHDDGHVNGELARAAACYASYDIPWCGKNKRLALIKILWPRQWSRRDYWKPKDRIRNLVRAGALIAAEIDRLQRLKGAGQ